VYSRKHVTSNFSRPCTLAISSRGSFDCWQPWVRKPMQVTCCFVFDLTALYPPPCSAVQDHLGNCPTAWCLQQLNSKDLPQVTLQ
jgi:hypothetical protein